MADINMVALSGRLTRDAEGHGDPGPRYALRFGLAVNGRKKDPASGQWVDSPSFVDCVMFGNFAAAVAPSLTTGAAVTVAGELRQRSYTDRDGNKRSAVEVIVRTLSAPKATGAPAALSHGDAYAQEDIPF